MNVTFSQNNRVAKLYTQVITSNKPCIRLCLYMHCDSHYVIKTSKYYWLSLKVNKYWIPYHSPLISWSAPLVVLWGRHCCWPCWFYFWCPPLGGSVCWRSCALLRILSAAPLRSAYRITWSRLPPSGPPRAALQAGAGPATVVAPFGGEVSQTTQSICNGIYTLQIKSILAYSHYLLAVTGPTNQTSYEVHEKFIWKHIVSNYIKFAFQNLL